MWQQWVNLILGLWVIVSTYIFTGSTLATDLTITGAVIAILAIWGALQHSTLHEREYRTTNR